MTSPGEDRNEGGPASVEPGRILVVDDEEFMRSLLTEILAQEGHQVTTAADGEEVVALLEREPFDLIMTDLVMPGLSGIEVLRAAKRIDPDCPVIIMTGYPSVESVVRLVRLGAVDYITKPFNVDVVKVTVAKLLEMRRLREHPPDVSPPERDAPDPDADPPDQSVQGR